MGLLRQLMDRQETYKGILMQLRQQEDKSFIDQVTAAEGMDEDAIIAAACILYELEDIDRNEWDEPREPRTSDLFWAIEFIDHLDTLGKKIVSK